MGFFRLCLLAALVACAYAQCDADQGVPDDKTTFLFSDPESLLRREFITQPHVSCFNCPEFNRDEWLIVGHPISLSGRWSNFGFDQNTTWTMFQDHVNGRGGLNITDKSSGVTLTKKILFFWFDIGLNETQKAKNTAYEENLTLPPGMSSDGTLVDWDDAALQAQPADYLPWGDAASDGTMTVLAAKHLAGGDLRTGRPPVDLMVCGYSSTLAPYSAWGTLQGSVYPNGTTARTIPIVTGHAASLSVYTCTSTTVFGCNDGVKVVGERRFPNLYSAIMGADKYMASLVFLGKLKGARKVGLWFEDLTFPRAIRDGLRITAAANQMTVQEWPISREGQRYARDNEVDNGMLRVAMAESQAADIELVIGATYTVACLDALPWLREQGWFPDGIGFSLCTGSSSFVGAIGDNGYWVCGSDIWTHRSKGVEYNEEIPGDVLDPRAQIFMFPVDFDNTDPDTNIPYSSAWIYNEQYKARWGREQSTYQAATALGSAYSVMYATLRAGRVQGDLIVGELGKMILENSFMGRISFARNGQIEKESATITQFITAVANASDPNGPPAKPDMYKELLAPLPTSTADYVYPAPKWEERESCKDWYGTTVEKIILSICAACIAFCIILAAFVIVKKDSSSIKASSPLFLLIILLGSTMMLVGTILWGLEQNDATCIAWLYLLVLGFPLMMAALFTKNYRVTAIFKKSQQLKRVSISNTRLLAMVGVIVGIALLLLIIWCAVDAPLAVVRVPDPARPGLNYRECSSDSDTDKVFGILIAVYFGIIIATNVVLAFIGRNIQTAYKESRYIAWAMYNLALCGLLLVIFLSVQWDDRELEYALRSIVLLFSVFGTVCILFLPKVIHIASGATSSSAGSGSSMSSRVGTVATTNTTSAG